VELGNGAWAAPCDEVCSKPDSTVRLITSTLVLD
jgi:hypothetical protein